MKFRAVLVILLGVVSLAIGWTPRKLVASYPAWNYWWLNTRIGADRFDTVYCAVARYNYSQSDPDHDLYILNSEGDTIRKRSPWHGYEYQPIVQDAAGTNIYIGQPTIGFWISSNYHMDGGATDDSNQIHSSRANSGDGVYYTKLAANGGRIYYNVKIYTGSPWAGKSYMAIDRRNFLYIAWGDNTQYLVYAKSTDRGASWVIDTLFNMSVLAQPKVVCDASNNVHFVWRTWTSGCQLRYMKLRPDGACAVDNSIFASASETWDPQIALDQGNNIHVVYTDAASGGHNIYYTAIKGYLDKNGQPASDSELTVVKDTAIQYDAVGLAYPKIALDVRQRPQVIFEQGQYGNNTDKAVYHIRGDAIVSVEESEIVRMQPRLPDISVYPNPSSGRVSVVYYVPSATSHKLTVTDAAGRTVIGPRSIKAVSGTNRHSLDMTLLPSGVYFVRISSSSGAAFHKLLLLR